MEGKTLYIFIDESGDFVFSNKGTNYFILTAVSTFNPLEKREEMMKVRYELLSDGFDLEYFHATEDKQVVRDKVYATLKNITNLEVDSVIAEKRKANFTLYHDLVIDPKRTSGFNIKRINVEEKFYKQICETLLQYVLHRYINLRSSVSVSKIVVIMDQCLTTKKREFVTKAIKTYIKNKFGLVPYTYFHSTKSDINSQIADYCCWAMKQKWDDKEMRPFNEIKSSVKSEFDIFKTGTHFYY
jgi:hypothetical protein